VTSFLQGSRTDLTAGLHYEPAALDAKADGYGLLDDPLVVAVLSNAQFRTEDVDVERALFGAMIGRRPSSEPPQAS
jgi:hypothetical protein